MISKRENALHLLNKYVSNQRMISHSLASEAVMIALAEKLNYDTLQWGLAGLLHDIDVEITNADPFTHGTKARELIVEIGLDEDIIEAIEVHNEDSTKIQRHKVIHHALAAAETICGLVFATAMVYPDKRISSVKPKSVVKRMKEKHFAASVKRENILECEKIGLSIQEFAEISISALSPIESILGFSEQKVATR